MKTSQYGRGRNPNSLKNLKRNIDRDPEELREMGRKGGTASGKVRRQRAKIRKILQKAVEFYAGIMPVMYCTFSDIAEELSIPYDQEPALVWLTLTIYSELRDQDKRAILTPDALRAIGLTESRTGEILKLWNQGMKAAPGDLPEELELLNRQYKEACGES